MGCHFKDAVKGKRLLNQEEEVAPILIWEYSNEYSIHAFLQPFSTYTMQSP